MAKGQKTLYTTHSQLRQVYTTSLNDVNYASSSSVRNSSFAAVQKDGHLHSFNDVSIRLGVLTMKWYREFDFAIIIPHIFLGVVRWRESDGTNLHIQP